MALSDDRQKRIDAWAEKHVNCLRCVAYLESREKKRQTGRWEWRPDAGPHTCGEEEEQ